MRQDQLPPCGKLELPGWVPAEVADMARSLIPDDTALPPETFALIKRLIGDPPLEWVWRELLKHKRIAHASTPDLFYSSILPGAVGSWADMATAPKARLSATSCEYLNWLC
jgi:hypothetical protein